MLIILKGTIVKDMRRIDGAADVEFVAESVESLERGECLRRDLDDDRLLVRTPTRAEDL